GDTSTLPLHDALPICRIASHSAQTGWPYGSTGPSASDPAALRPGLTCPIAIPPSLEPQNRTGPPAPSGPGGCRWRGPRPAPGPRSEEHTSELQSRENL